MDWSQIRVINPVLAEVTIQDWIASGFIIVAAVAIIFGIRRLLTTIGDRFKLQEYVVEMIGRILTAIVVVVAILYVLNLLDVEVGPLIGGLGISGIIVAVALQPVFGNLMGSVLLHAGRPIRPGDQIDTNGISGTVVDISNRSVEILDFDGDTVFVPNLLVLDTPLKNRTADHIRRATLNFDVAYDTDLRSTQQALAKAIRNVDGVVAMPGAEVLVTAFGDSGINLTALFWHPSEQLSARWIVSEVAIAIRETLTEIGVEIPFPQRVLHEYNGNPASTAASKPPDGNDQA